MTVYVVYLPPIDFTLTQAKSLSGITSEAFAPALQAVLQGLRDGNAPNMLRAYTELKKSLTSLGVLAERDITQAMMKIACRVVNNANGGGMHLITRFGGYGEDISDLLIHPMLQIAKLSQQKSELPEILRMHHLVICNDKKMLTEILVTDASFTTARLREIVDARAQASEEAIQPPTESSTPTLH